MSSCKLFLTIIIAGAFLGTFATDYCKVKSCRYGEIQTMCKYPSPYPAPQCGKWKMQGLSEAEKRDIVDMHNTLRQRVAAGKETRGKPGPQPAAVNIPNLVWDNELETIAQRWVNQCKVAHSCDNTENYLVGQNVAAAFLTGNLKERFDLMKVKDMVQGWYNEVDIFPRDFVSHLPKDTYAFGHYINVVSDVSTKIGCGRIIFESSSDKNTYFLVCDYGPSNIMTNGPLYKTKA